jgi:hypothetical protein
MQDAMEVERHPAGVGSSSRYGQGGQPPAATGLGGRRLEM